MEVREEARVLPLLVRNSVPRTGDDKLPGSYDEARHVWIVDDQPLVTSQSKVAELQTKTEARVERDDVAPRFVLEMQTKTKAQLERDDQSTLGPLREMLTKTSTTPERDD